MWVLTVMFLQLFYTFENFHNKSERNAQGEEIHEKEGTLA